GGQLAPARCLGGAGNRRYIPAGMEASGFGPADRPAGVAFDLDDALEHFHGRTGSAQDRRGLLQLPVADGAGRLAGDHRHAGAVDLPVYRIDLAAAAESPGRFREPLNSAGETI